MGESEDFYPQLLGSMMIIDPPGWVFVLWKIMRPFFPRRLIEKINFVSTKKNSADTDGYCSAYISKSDLPKIFGGENDAFPTSAVESLGDDPDVFKNQKM